MSYYRLYFMDAFSGHIEGFEDFEASTDEEAVAAALDHEGLRALELWCQHRKVARVESVSLGSQLLDRRRKFVDGLEGRPNRPDLRLVESDNPKSASSQG